MNKDDIYIGENDSIEFISLEGRYDLAVQVDDVLNPLFPLLDRLETNCVAGCCGFDAFDFTLENIKRAAIDLDRRALDEACTDAINAVEKVDSGVVVSSRMNNLADRAVMVMLLNHIRSSILKSAQQGDAPDPGSSADPASQRHRPGAGDL